MEHFSQTITGNKLVDILCSHGWAVEKECNGCYTLVKEQEVVTVPAAIYLTKEKMYELYPRKWLFVNEPVQRKSDAEIVGGELLSISDGRKVLYQVAGLFKPRSCAIISSMQEED